MHPRRPAKTAKPRPASATAAGHGGRSSHSTFCSGHCAENPTIQAVEAQKSVRTLCRCDEINAELEDVSISGGATACAAKALLDAIDESSSSGTPQTSYKLEVAVAEVHAALARLECEARWTANPDVYSALFPCAIAARHSPSAAYALARELMATQRVSAATYAAAKAALGSDRAMAALAMTMGCYSAVSTILNVFEVALPAGAEHPFPEPEA